MTNDHMHIIVWFHITSYCTWLWQARLHARAAQGQFTIVQLDCALSTDPWFLSFRSHFFLLWLHHHQLHGFLWSLRDAAYINNMILLSVAWPGRFSRSIVLSPRRQRYKWWTLLVKYVSTLSLSLKQLYIENFFYRSSLIEHSIHKMVIWPSEDDPQISPY